MRTLVSSAKRIRNKSFDDLEKSFINTLKNSGLRIDPWGTPWEKIVYAIFFYTCT